MLRYIKWIVFVSILIGLIWFIRETDMNAMSVSLQKIGWGGFGLILLSTFLAYLLATIGWRCCLPKTHYSIIQLFMIRHIGEVVTLINPTSIVGGEATKWTLMNDEQVNKKEVAVSIMVSRIILIYTQLICFGIVFIYLLLSNVTFPVIITKSVGILYGIIFLAICMLCAVYKRKKSDLTATDPGKKGWLHKYILQLQTVIIASFSFLKTHPKAVLWSSIAGLLHWVVGALEIYWTLNYLGLPCTIPQAIFIDLGVVFFKTAGASIPGQIGIEELGNKVMLEMIGIKGAEVWITLSMVRRARQICWICLAVLGYACIQPLLRKPNSISHGSIIRQS
ncbi:MAG: flippase-like domain-containing protein [Chitinophagaceae bacterium]|nr:flippase-like domain-containing protein [Chitinophagaceae bacterium]